MRRWFNGDYVIVDAPEGYPGKVYRRGRRHGAWIQEHHLVWWQVTGAAVPPGFVLHHVNGNKEDNRFENLERMAAGDHARWHYDNPRVSAQAPKRVYLSSAPQPPKEPPRCACGEVMAVGACQCGACWLASAARFRIRWPSDDDLSSLVWTKPLVVLARDLGVSDTAIKKRCKRRAVVLPPRGYWARAAERRTGA